MPSTPQLGIDLDELKNQINDDMASFYQMYDSEEEEPQTCMVMILSLVLMLFLITLKFLLSLMNSVYWFIERDNPYWLLVPHNDELIHRIIVTYNHTFGDEEPIQLIE